MKKYEIMYIVNASLDDAARTKLMDSFHKIITDHEGTIDKVDEWGVKEFAYEINHILCCSKCNCQQRRNSRIRASGTYQPQHRTLYDYQNSGRRVRLRRMDI